MLKTCLKFFALIIFLLLLLVMAIMSKNYIFWQGDETVSINSQGVELSGTFVKPEGQGPFPTILLLMGAGPETREDIGYRSTVKFYVRQGFAVLFYDKQGAGKSNGDFSQTTLHSLRDDAAAALSYLKTRSEVNTEQMGLHTISESSWFAMELAQQFDEIDFLVQKVGTPFNWPQTVIWEVESDARLAGVPESAIPKLIDITFHRWEYYQAIVDGIDNLNELKQSIETQTAKLIQEVPEVATQLPAKLPEYTAEDLKYFSINYQYSSVQHLKTLDLPVLFLYGENDINVPTSKAVAYLEELKNAHGRTNIEYVVFNGVGHSLFSKFGVFDGGFIPGYFDHISNWLEKHDFKTSL